MRVYVKLPIDIDKNRPKVCGAKCPWRCFSSCTAYSAEGAERKLYSEPGIYFRTAKCLRNEVKK